MSWPANDKRVSAMDGVSRPGMDFASLEQVPCTGYSGTWLAALAPPRDESPLPDLRPAVPSPGRRPKD